MEFDPSFQEKNSHLSGIFYENPCIKSNIPMAEENTTFMYQNNSNHFQNYPLNKSNFNHPASFFTKFCFSTITPQFSLSSKTPSLGDSSSYKPTYPNETLKRGFVNRYHPMPFAPNNTNIESMHDNHNTNKGIWDFSKGIPIHSDAGATSSCPQRKSNGKFQHKLTNIIKGHWSAEEDMVLVQLVKRFGLKKWSQIAKMLNGRVGKQCRERWNNHLRPNIKKVLWNEEEDKILIEAHKEVGNKWAEIARRMPGRTENTIKNRWNATKRRLNGKKQTNKHTTTSKGATTLLQNYIRQVIKAEEAEKELKKFISKMSIKGESSLFHVRYESSNNDFGFKEDKVGWSVQHDVPHGGGYYVPMMASSEEMATGSIEGDSKMDSEVAMEMSPKVPIEKEMDLMEMISRFLL